jgi:DNA-binding transcriptional LysR family regulator
VDRFGELRIFVTVVEAGGFSAAAERLNLAWSAVPRRVRELEDRLGARLLHRTTGTLGLTDAGRIFHARAAALLLDLAEPYWDRDLPPPAAMSASR